MRLTWWCSRGSGGYFTLDALMAAGVLVMILILVASLMYAGYVMERENLGHFGDVLRFQNHLDRLWVRESWWDLDGVTEELSEGVVCSYELSDSGHGVIRLTVTLDMHGRRDFYVLERRG